jgi:tetratricopeptide (TPR) repeat protein
MRKLSFTALLFTAACVQENAQKPEELTGTTSKAQEAKPVQPEIKEIPVTSSNPAAVEQYQKGRELAENARGSEAATYFAKAIELDPSFALAHASLAMTTPGPEGMKSAETAATLTANLPEDERTLVEVMVASKRGDAAKVGELYTKLVTVAPTDWRAHNMAASHALERGDYEGATAGLKKAIELNPKAGSAYNLLGYAALRQGKKEEAVDAFKKYAEVSPSEPNPHDSLADALLASGKLEEAEAAYAKAIEIAPTMWFSWNGIAATRALRANWAGAEEALTKAKETAPDPNDKMFMAMDIAWLRFAQNKTKEAFAALDEVEKQALAEKLDLITAHVALHRAAMFSEIGKPKEAIKQVETAWTRAEKAAIQGHQMMKIRTFGLHVRAIAEAKLGKKDDLAKTIASFEEEAKKDPNNTFLASGLNHIQGLAANVAGDPKLAAEHFGKCIAEDVLCAYHQVEAEEKAGNKAGADAIRERIVSTPMRDSLYLYVRSKLATIQAS